MMSKCPGAFIIVGPTASGKSSVAQYLAEQSGAAIVSSDSMNIYRGMDIGTAKPSVAERGSVHYAGVDLADPSDAFSVADWLTAVAPAFEKGADVIVAGGTGLYVRCLLQGLDRMPAADEALRARAETMALAELQAEAREAAPQSYERLADKKNPRRLIRLIEQGERAVRKGSGELPAVIGLHVERDVLNRRIIKRVDEMYAAGLVEEARGLMDRDLSSTAQHAIGYAEAFAVLKNEMTEAQAKERTVIRTRQLAKRQRTWFRTQLNVQWIHTAEFSSLETLASEVSNVWKKVPVVLPGMKG